MPEMRKRKSIEGRKAKRETAILVQKMQKKVHKRIKLL